MSPLIGNLSAFSRVQLWQNEKCRAILGGGENSRSIPNFKYGEKRHKEVFSLNSRPKKSTVQSVIYLLQIDKEGSFFPTESNAADKNLPIEVSSVL